MRTTATCHRSLCAAVLVNALLAGGADAGVSRLRRMVVVGDSLLAGFGSGGFVGVGRPGQVDSAPAFVARRAQVRLPLPFLSAPGVPPPLGIVDANGNGRLDRGVVRRTQDGLGFRAHPGKTARNLAVPGEDTRSVFQEIAAEDTAGELVTGDVNGRDVLKLLILGLPLRPEPVSQVSRARPPSELPPGLDREQRRARHGDRHQPPRADAPTARAPGPPPRLALP